MADMVRRSVTAGQSDIVGGERTLVTPQGGEARRWIVLAVLALASGLCYAAITVLSNRFVYGQGFIERPIVEVLVLFSIAFGAYLFALRVATRCPPGRALQWLIVAPAVVFRLTLLASQPIQEIDIYRYLWDGAAGACGVSPFRFSPQQVSAASLEDDLPADLARLVALRDESPTLAAILSRVHYGELPTVYPPVSQAVFALTALVTPRQASLAQRVTMMKTAIVGFDLATLWLVVKLLRLTGRHVGWCLAYGWCPLVMKEFANSGHLDSIAMALTMAAAYLVVLALQARDQRGGGLCRLSVAGVLLGLAIGAKLYPLVLTPLLVATAWRRWGCREALLTSSVLAATTSLVLWPMLPRRGDGAILGNEPVVAATADLDDEAAIPPLAPGDACEGGPPTEPIVTGPQDPSLGLRTFLGRWEMNDFVFLLLIENLKLDADTPENQRPWFSIVPNSWRAWLLAPMVAHRRLAPRAGAFVFARVLTAAVFIPLALCLAWRGSASGDAAAWLRACFLTLAWFWLLSPTQNPWYWTWALPLAPFARGRAWLAVSGLTMLYYLRFWLAYHWPESAVAGTGYHGTQFFDFVVTWIEFGPWFGWLLVDSWRRPS